MKKKEYEEVFNLYEELEKNNNILKSAGVHDYSLINSLLKANDEVNLHSKFIFSMINPAGLHYCGNKFLEIFLKQVGCEGFIDIEKAVVHREKGNIDLLIHDDNKFIIIENKLDAGDQEHQITRYIKYVKERFLSNDNDLSEKIIIIYLSKNKSYPSNKSLIGFNEPDDKGFIKWVGIEESEIKPLHLSELKYFTLKEGSKISYIHMNYFEDIQMWVDNCRCWLVSQKNEKKGLIYAFNEYKLILKRLDKSKPWKKIMGLCDYCYTKDVENGDREKMYSFMVEARAALPEYISRIIAEAFGDVLNNKRGKRNVNSIFSIDELTEVSLDGFTNDCIKWINKTGKSKVWRDIGFIILDQNNEYWYFLMGYENIFFGKVDQLEGSRFTVKKIVSNRKKLLKLKGLSSLITTIGKILEEIGEQPT